MIIKYFLIDTGSSYQPAGTVKAAYYTGSRVCSATCSKLVRICSLKLAD